MCLSISQSIIRIINVFAFHHFVFRPSSKSQILHVWLSMAQVQFFVFCDSIQVFLFTSFWLVLQHSIFFNVPYSHIASSSQSYIFPMWLSMAQIQYLCFLIQHSFGCPMHFIWARNITFSFMIFFIFYSTWIIFIDSTSDHQRGMINMVVQQLSTILFSKFILIGSDNFFVHEV